MCIRDSAERYSIGFGGVAVYLLGKRNVIDKFPHFVVRDTVFEDLNIIHAQLIRPCDMVVAINGTRRYFTEGKERVSISTADSGTKDNCFRISIPIDRILADGIRVVSGVAATPSGRHGHQ